MPMVWDNAADAELFAAVVATSEPKFDYNKLAVIMGPECTAKAITHRITKLREIAKNFDTTAATTQTPVKRVRKPKAKAAKSDGDDDESPTKKQKTAKPKKAAKSEAEQEAKKEDNGGGCPARAEENSSIDE